jgi:UDP-N-acetylglucosamine 4,6-dehydratase/5-epimerase
MASRLGPRPELRFFLGDVRDEARMVEAFHGCKVVVHAAALKRIDAVAYDPEEVLKTNVQGTVNTIRAAVKAEVHRVVVISSDKACAPANAYGASKLMAEFCAVQANAWSHPRGTLVSAVRYGNVLSSNGSVVHLFRDAVRRGEPVPITDPRCTRFFLTLDQAVNIILAAIEHMQGGEIFVPRLPSMNIEELAEAIAGEDYPLTGVGLRPGGEKLGEQMISEEEATRTLEYIPADCDPELMLIQPTHRTWDTTPWKGAPRTEGAYRSDTNPWTLSVDEMRRLVR